ncbi:glycosyltransferase [Ruminococcus sp. AF18-22]|nr:glycosyltransferase [Ruminococcus sp. AF18-22]
MKICHMTSAHPSKDIRIFYKECVTLAERGNEVILIAPGSSFKEKGVYVEGIEDSVSRLRRMLFTSRKVFKKAVEIDADIYHFHDPELLPYGLKLKKRGKHVFYDSHEDVPRQILAKTWIPKIIRKFVSFIYEKYEKRISVQLDCVFTATEHIKNIFQRYNCRAESIKNYPLLDDIQCFNQNYYTRQNLICYAGGVTEQRGITTLVEAVEDIDVKVNIAGKAEEEYLNQLKRLKAWRKVNYLGYLDRQAISNLYNSSRIGIVTLKDTPNHRFSLPIKMFEYMAAGIPVIASDFSEWKDIVDMEKCGLCVNPNNKEEIANAIAQLLKEPETAKAMGENGRRAICEKYSWNNEGNKMLEVYQEIYTKE